MAEEVTMTTALIAGGSAGIVSDIILFPLDTLKTRLQSASGFERSGAFRGLYQGIGSAALGSAPSSASFFLVYELCKNILPVSSEVIKHGVAACMGETFATTVRMPFEVVKQHSQVKCVHRHRTHCRSSSTVFFDVLKRDGLMGLYRGWFSTLTREVPFSFLQMPMWEYFKKQLMYYAQTDDVTPLQSGVCGSVAGGFAAALTTPLDVAKTRIVLTKDSLSSSVENPFVVVVRIARQEGLTKLFSGLTPRVIWISIGGFIFLGAYDQTRLLLQGCAILRDDR